MTDLIDRQAAIDAINNIMPTKEGLLEPSEVFCELMELPSAQPGQTDMIKEIRKWINSGNRGPADYFIVDMIEEVLDKYDGNEDRFD